VARRTAAHQPPPPPRSPRGCWSTTKSRSRRRRWRTGPGSGWRRRCAAGCWSGRAPGRGSPPRTAPGRQVVAARLAPSVGWDADGFCTAPPAGDTLASRPMACANAKSLVGDQALVVEVGRLELPSHGVVPGLLRAQPSGQFRAEAVRWHRSPTLARKDVPGTTAGTPPRVSLLTSPSPLPQAKSGGRLPDP
jgi:hypothetical protein